MTLPIQLSQQRGERFERIAWMREWGAVHTFGKSFGSFMEPWIAGKTPCPAYTKAITPNTSGSVDQLASAVAAPPT